MFFFHNKCIWESSIFFFFFLEKYVSIYITKKNCFYIRVKKKKREEIIWIFRHITKLIILISWCGYFRSGICETVKLLEMLRLFGYSIIISKSIKYLSLSSNHIQKYGHKHDVAAMTDDGHQCYWRWFCFICFRISISLIELLFISNFFLFRSQIQSKNNWYYNDFVNTCIKNALKHVVHLPWRHSTWFFM